MDKRKEMVLLMVVAAGARLIPDLIKPGMTYLMKPYHHDQKLTAYRVLDGVTNSKVDTNVPEVVKPLESHYLNEAFTGCTCFGSFLQNSLPMDLTAINFEDELFNNLCGEFECMVQQPSTVEEAEEIFKLILLLYSYSEDVPTYVLSDLFVLSNAVTYTGVKLGLTDFATHTTPRGGNIPI